MIDLPGILASDAGRIIPFPIGYASSGRGTIFLMSSITFVGPT